MKLPALRYRTAFWLIAIACILAWRFLTPETAPPEPLVFRPATLEEWNSSIQTLGQSNQGKRLAVIGAQSPHKGMLVWWHDGEQERFSYLADPSEEAMTTLLELGSQLKNRKLFISNGNDGLVQRFLNADRVEFSVPAGFTILDMP